MRPATRRAASPHASDGIQVTLLWHPARTRSPSPSRTPTRTRVPARGRSRPRPRRLLPPLRLRGLKEERAMSRTTHTNRNLAARMGRWSARHWKTATFGWLAFVLVAFGLGGMVGTRNIDPQRGPGRVRPHGPDPRGRLRAARLRERPDPEPVARVGTTAFDAAIADVVARVSKVAAVRNVRSPLDPANAGQISTGPPLRPRRVPDPRRQGEGGRQDRPGPGRCRAAAARPSRLHDRRVRRRERREGGRGRLRRGPREGRDALAPDHADRPRPHVRLARRGGHSAPARADRGVRDLRARRALERRLAGRDAGPGDGAPDRARRGRRLLDVLLEARAAGTRRGAQRAGGARGRGGDVRPLGAHLRPDRDGGDGRHVPHRRPDLRLPRSGHDPRRRRRGARVADRASRPALAARRQGRPARASRSSVASAATTAKGGSGARSSTASCAGRRSRRRRRCCAAGRSPRPALQLRLAAGAESFRSRSEVIKTYDRMQQAFPGSALPANVVVEAPSVRTPAMQQAIARARATGARERPLRSSRSPSTSTSGHGREHHRPDRR